MDRERQLAQAITDPNFERLELAMREANIFRALDIERYEIRHSNFFAYLLDPRENHGLADILLRKFLRDIFADSRADRRTLFDADLMDLHQADVRREWRDIDILIELTGDVIAVENKVDSSEHSNQLRKYRRTVEAEFPAKRKHFVFLTPFGADAADAKDQEIYINYSYAQIAAILENVREIYGDSISEKLDIYLSDYLTTIKRELLMNDKLNDLAIKVYKAHRDAFDFVFENRPDPANVLYPFFEEEVKSRGFVIGSKNKGFVRFTSKELAERLPKTGEGWPDKEIFLFQIDYFWNDKQAVAKAIICKGDDALHQTILAAVKGLKKYRKPEGKKFTAFYLEKPSFTASIVASEDKSEIEAQVKSVIDAVADDAKEIFAMIERALPATAQHVRDAERAS
jgi:hypothetical protein